MVIRAFNGVYFGVMILTVLLIVAITKIFSKKDRKTKENVILCISIANIVFFTVYKILLAVRTPGLPDTYSFDIWCELPIHLCNISLFLIPIGAKLKNDMIMSYGFFITPLGAFFAMTFPCAGFGNLNIFYLHMIGFYGTHLILIVMGILLVTLGLYEPSFKKLPKMFAFIAVLSAVIFGVNVLLRSVTPSPVNYFYTCEPEGISILEFFWSIIPVPYIYLRFALLILLVYASIIITPFHIIRKKRKS